MAETSFIRIPDTFISFLPFVEGRKMEVDEYKTISSDYICLGVYSLVLTNMLQLIPLSFIFLHSLTLTRSTTERC